MSEPTTAALRRRVTFGSTAETHYYSPAEYEGRQVMVHELLYSEQGPCRGHDFAPLTHFGEDTGQVMCHLCMGIIEEGDDLV